MCAITSINTPADLERGLRILSATEPRLARVWEIVGTPPIRREKPGLRFMLQVVTEQSISLKAAAAIWSRLDEEMNLDDPASVLAVPAHSLRQLGLNRVKGRAFHTIAQADNAGLFNRLATMTDDDVRSSLTSLYGVGPWTAEIYVLSALGRRNAWPAGDVALQNAVQRILELSARPDVKEMHAIARAWQPWRSVAARLCWSWIRRE